MGIKKDICVIDQIAFYNCENDEQHIRWGEVMLPPQTK